MADFLPLAGDVWLLGFLMLVAAAAGLARGFSGFGAAMIMGPLASTIVGPQVAIPLILVVDGVASLALLPKVGRLANRPDVARVTVGAMIGVPLGAYLLIHLDPLTIRWSIVAVIAVLLTVLGSGWRYHGKPWTPLTVGVGTVAGLLSGLAQLGGPPVVAYWLGGTSSVAVVRANLILYFALATVLSAIAYIWSGLITPDVLILSAIIAPVYGVAVWLGGRMFGWANERTFRRICYGMIAAAALVSMPLLDGILR
ncbi:MAG: sulfite exporter TauE/SafE family protein [Rhodospirillales bacterium]|nr:sulfite exporter TauE/SafE family protein [Rhodospirillales bacterium]